MRSFEDDRVKAREDKRQKRKANEALDTIVQQIPSANFVCQTCGRACKSRMEQKDTWDYSARYLRTFDHVGQTREAERQRLAEMDTVDYDYYEEYQRGNRGDGYGRAVSRAALQESCRVAPTHATRKMITGDVRPS